MSTAAVVVCFDRAAAVPVFSQTPTVIMSADQSDRDTTTDGEQLADNFALATPATVRSVVWRGAYGLNDTPTFPLSFDVIFYADAGGLPDKSAVLSSTAINFATAADVIDTGSDVFGGDLYEFAANVTPTSLPAGETLWFSVLADTANDLDDDFFWVAGSFMGGMSAARADVSGDGDFVAADLGPFYFVLDDTAIPEPGAAFALATAGGLVLRRRR